MIARWKRMSWRSFAFRSGLPFVERWRMCRRRRVPSLRVVVRCKLPLGVTGRVPLALSRVPSVTGRRVFIWRMAPFEVWRRRWRRFSRLRRLVMAQRIGRAFRGRFRGSDTCWVTPTRTPLSNVRPPSRRTRLSVPGRFPAIFVKRLLLRVQWLPLAPNFRMEDKCTNKTCPPDGGTGITS